jgi:hypothetical protein
MLNQTLFKCMSCLIMFGLYGVFMMCYNLYGELRILLREVEDRGLQKGK